MCSIAEFNLMRQEVRDLYGAPANLFAIEDSFSMAPKTDQAPSFDMDLFNANMVRIAIWPYTMEDDEIVFDPETGKLTKETAPSIICASIGP